MTNLKKLHNYWSDKKEQGSLPARSDLDPIDFHYALGNVSLIDVDQAEGEQEPSFKVRLLGSNIQSRIGSAFANRNLDDFPEKDSLSRMRSAYKEVITTKEPLAYPSFFRVGETELPFICCIWPLSSDGINIDMLLCCREQLFKPDLIPTKQYLKKNTPTWAYTNWGQSELLNQLVH